MHAWWACCVRAWWAARREAAPAGTPLGKDGRPSTCAISDPRRPPGTFDTPNHIVSSVSVGWWRSRGEVWLTPVDLETAYPKKLTRPGASSDASPVKKNCMYSTRGVRIVKHESMSTQPVSKKAVFENPNTAHTMYSRMLFRSRGFVRKGDRVHIIYNTFRVTTRLRSKSNRCIWRTILAIWLLTRPGSSNSTNTLL
jgi:hypothetical protein